MLLGPKPVFPSGSLYKDFPAKSSQLSLSQKSELAMGMSLGVFSRRHKLVDLAGGRQGWDWGEDTVRTGRPRPSSGDVEMPLREMGREQIWMLPPTLDELLPLEHPARFVAEFVSGIKLFP